ncbi:DUF2868 domain-containing protein [Spiribacter vilamensis]|uniref:Uncharacterized protein DUF2868 n=1 Tax=Spiribacter vilamensis TaxID=531306 RepID=A0A4Q8CZS4_9GAMM|nr:DUF2868 domain-containing protein [Spiribacter vilamensis]RZU98541.1 uncharacterized protein DUF2868 [Spiribacter vilamensis]TVO60200.1 DUF2868 domain-containing protein [Spiribacter vilamensis]
MAVTIHDWILTEAVRLHEQQHGRSHDDDTANAVARSTNGSLTDQLAARAVALPEAATAAADLKHLKHAFQLFVMAALVGAALAGWFAARAALEIRDVDALLVLVALLGLPSLTLVGWLIVMIARPGWRSDGMLIGPLLRGFLERLAPKFLHSDLAPSLVRACVYLLRTPAGQSRLAAIIHGFWLAYTSTAIAAMALYFSIIEYTLSWGTTILDAEVIVGLVSGLASLPAALGLMPEVQSDWVLAARDGTATAAHRAAWAAFLVGAVAIYGALPRLVLAVVYGLLGHFQGNRMALDTGLPGYLRLRELVHPASAPANQSEAPMATLPRAPRQAAETATGPILVIAAERTTDDLLAAIPDLSAPVIGAVDTRAARRQLIAALQAQPHPTTGLLATCSLLRTPDTGTAYILGDMAKTADAPLILVLHDATELASRGGDPQARIADWDRLADSIGADYVVFDHQQPDPAAIASIRQWTDEAETA